MNPLVRRSAFVIAGAVLAFFCFVSWCLADQKELMDEWVKHKKHITERIVTKLRNEGKLPQSGTIEFSARVKTLTSGDLEIVIDDLKVHPKQAEAGSSASKNLVGGGVAKTTDDEAVARQFQEIFRPRNPAPYWTTGTIHISSGKVSGENFRIQKTEEGPTVEKSEKQEQENQQVKKYPEETTSSTDGSKASSETASRDSPREQMETKGLWDRFLMWLLGKEEGGKQ